MESQPLAVVVLAAGLGKRMVSRQPKVLHRLAGLPLVAHVLRAVAPLDPTRTVLVVGHDSDQVQSAIGQSYGPRGSFPIEYATQTEQLGTGHALHMAKTLLHDFHGPVLVLYGDSPLLKTATLSALLARHRQARARLTILTCIAADPTGYGRVVRDANQRLVEVVEERNATLVQRAISEVNSGVYVFDSHWLWPHLEKIEVNAQGEYNLSDLVGRAVEQDKGGPGQARGAVQSNVITYTQEGLGEAMGIHSRAQLAEAEHTMQIILRERWMEAGVTILLPETIYLGVDVTIGSDTVLWPGSVVEGHSSIGENCVIGPNTHISDSIIGDGCHIEASTVISSEVPAETNIGPYAYLRESKEPDGSANL